jgi:hypothetical protein
VSDLRQNVHNDLLLVQEAFGSEFIYEQHGDQLTAISFDDEGNEVARYTVKVSLEKL